MNQCNFIGRLVRDPELNETNSGKKVLNITIAINEKEKTEFIDLVFWEKSAEIVSKYCKKGQLISVTTKYRLKKFQDKNGLDRYQAEFNVINFELLGGNPSQVNSPGEVDSSASPFNSEDIPF